MIDVAIVGAGYVGVPLAQVFAEAGVSAVSSTWTPTASPRSTAARATSRTSPRGSCARSSSRARSRRTTDYDALRDADAILVALPTPLSVNREPDISIVTRRGRGDRQAPAPGPPRRARVDHLPGNDPGGGAAHAGSERPPSRHRLPPRLLARARRPGPHRLDDEDDAQDRRRHHRELQRRRLRLLRARDGRGHRRLLAGGGRADEAPREHLPLGQHRARQRAGAALRPHGRRRLGGRGRRRHEALRLHELQAGPGPRRPLPAGRPVLPLLEGAASTTSTPSSSSSRGRSTRTCRTSAWTRSRGR